MQKLYKTPNSSKELYQKHHVMLADLPNAPVTSKPKLNRTDSQTFQSSRRSVSIRQFNAVCSNNDCIISRVLHEAAERVVNLKRLELKVSLVRKRNRRRPMNQSRCVPSQLEETSYRVLGRYNQ